ncbi:MAG: hypothetical protein JW861_10335 [Bacteroidales bacterium]|nr:hypothetical protein [Bacteroidales bacterium]
MKECIMDYMKGLQFGAMQSFGNMAVVPVVARVRAVLDYITLKEAIKAGELLVTEVSEGGSVPNLKVVNKGGKPVLLVEGEELTGARQNRIVNTSMMVGGYSEVVIPVSCTERGRWGYRGGRHQGGFRSHADNADRMRQIAETLQRLTGQPNLLCNTGTRVEQEGSGGGQGSEEDPIKRIIPPDAMDASEEMLPSSARFKNTGYVFYCLKQEAKPRSDQGEIWQDIDDLHTILNTRSSTGAMKDSYDQHRNRLEEYLSAFPVTEGQQGMVVFINGNVAGMDVVSRPEAFQQLHGQMIRSYAMDASVHQPEQPDVTHETSAVEFIGQVAAGTVESFRSVGLGEDVRMSAEGITGAALTVTGEVIHLRAGRIDNRKDRQEDHGAPYPHC